MVTELVMANQVLADYPGLEKYREKGYEKGPLTAGNHTVFSDDGDSLLSTVIGYPKITLIKQEDDSEIPMISVIPLVNISFDKLSAALCIYPALPDLPGLREDNLEQLVEQAGIKHGIDASAVERALEIIAAGRVEIAELQIASGTKPGEGHDAYLVYNLEIGPIAGQLLPDGRIDFRERRIMVGVKEGQVVATKVPAVPGTPGKNVLGEIIESKSGKDIKVKTPGDVDFSPETMEVKALKDGVMSVVNEDTIKISSRHTVTSDVDFSTGNVESEGCLVIRGGIQPGFKIDCGGDLEISETVSSAQVNCGANAVIKGGITGKNSDVQIAGDADIKFIEQGKLSAGGIIVIRKQAYFSKVTSQSDIRCHPSSNIMGGSLIAGGHLTVGTIGSESSDTAIIAAGVDPERLLHYRDLQNQLETQQNEIIQWLQLHGRAKSRKVRKMEEAIDETKLQLLKINLIPGTELYSRGGAGKTREDIEEQNPMYHAGIDVDRIRVDIHGTAFPGTRILLGNRAMVLDKAVSKRQLKLSSDMKRIIALPLRSRD